MASSSGTSSGSPPAALTQSSGSEEELPDHAAAAAKGTAVVMDQRKRKRMISNRESARRSRMRKQKHLDDLVDQVSQLRNDNRQIMASVSLTTQNYLTIDAKNSILRAQVSELSHRLQSLNDIIRFINANNYGVSNYNSGSVTSVLDPGQDLLFNPFNMGYNNYLNQPIPASVDAFLC